MRTHYTVTRYDWAQYEQGLSQAKRRYTAALRQAQTPEDYKTALDQYNDAQRDLLRRLEQSDTGEQTHG